MINEIQKDKLLNLLQLYKCFGIKYIPNISLQNVQIHSNNKLPESNEILREYIEHCNLCELSKSCAKQVGEGDPRSNIYIVGLNSNFSDYNLQNYLKYLLGNSFGADLKEFYMTNIIKCDANKVSLNHEQTVFHCKEFFLQELEINKPKFILATRSAARYILKNDLASDDVLGESFQLNGSKVFPIFDFDFISKNPSYQEEMMRVFNKIRGMIH